MLRSLKITKLRGDYPTHLHENVENRLFKFDKGLNIIVGPNGSGKSTLLKCIKHSYKIDEYHKLSNAMYMGSLIDIDFKVDMDNEAALDCDKFYHVDNPEEMNYARDYDMINFARAYDKNVRSSGEMKMTAQEDICKYIDSDNFRSARSKFTDNKDELLFLFDEPTLGMAPDIDSRFFDYMQSWADSGLQLLIATNSPFCLHCNANFIELDKGYLIKQNRFLNKYLKRLKDNA